ncbi:MAG TPA: glycosyl hydrolase family 65 protein [Acidimicrobiia bacterium]|nr:glycosyl hydrolase family 65 protein [Acidimicrobiia bacterium]
MRTAREFTPTDYGSDPWIIEIGGTDPDQVGIYETILALSNGHVGARGGFEQGDPRHQPGVFVNGFHETWSIDYPESAYGYAKTGQTILHAPDTTGVRVLAGDRPLVLAEADVTRRLDLRNGLVTTTAVWPDVTVRWLRLVSLGRRHLLAVRVEIERKGTGSPAQNEERKGTGSPAQNEERKGTGQLSIESGWRNRQDTDYLAAVDDDSDPRRARSFERRTLLAGPVEVEGASMATTFRTVRSGMTLALAVEHRPGTSPIAVESPSIDEFEFTLQGSTIEKIAAYALTSDPAEAAAELAKAPDFAGLAREQGAALDEFWSHAGVDLGGEPQLQQAVNWSLFQLHQASAQVRGKGIPAKGLTGQAYEGHYFWDTDVFVLPFLAHHSPGAAAELIRFRHALLPAARLRARELSHVGALYPWRTINGEEASAYYEAGTAQFHIDAAVVYGVDAYLKATGDEELLWDCGVEIAAETARFWADLGFFDRSQPAAPSFHIHMCTGPDEYSALVDDNAYTNYMARFNLAAAARWTRRMSAEQPARFQVLADRIGLDPTEIDAWEAAAAAMELPVDPDRGITPQDARFLEREAWDWDTPDDQYPLLLNFHPLVIYRHQVLKQADVVMAMFLLPDAFSDDLTRANFDYYDPITTSDSSLSPAIQSAVAARIGRSDLAMAYFRHAAFLDLANLAGNTADGVHMATVGGVWHALVSGFGGFAWRGDRPYLAPNLPTEWDRLGFAVSIRGSKLRVEVVRESVTVHLLTGEPVDLDILGTVHTITREPTVVVR